jgi:Ni,Fe-hydrogenase III large subunit
MPPLADLLHAGRQVTEHRPWPRAAIGPETWRFAAEQLVNGSWTLLGLWGEPAMVHMALVDEDNADVAIASLDCPDRTFLSIGRFHAPALRLERAIRDLYGLQPEGSSDKRPWLDHGRWSINQPLGGRSPASEQPPYEFLPVEGESLHQIPVGPVHAGIIEPGHFRFTANGETVVRLEERLGYVHKGIEGLMAGADLAHAAKLAGRVSGDSTVAYSIAFARAAEAAIGLDVPPRAHWLRGLMAELERLANHLGDIGAICNDAAFALMHAHCSVLRERVLRVADVCFGHRLMRDRIVPGGVTIDLGPEGMAACETLITEIRAPFARLVDLYDSTASLQDRTVGTGTVDAALVKTFGAGGFVGRASGRSFDARKALPYPPYDQIRFDMPVRQDGDVNARVWIRIDEVRQSLSLIEQLLAGLPQGPTSVDPPTPPGSGEGLALVEGFRGDILAWVRLANGGRIERCHLRDPSWFQWPLLEVAIKGNIVADFPLCNKSFNCSYSGHDL